MYKKCLIVFLLILMMLDLRVVALDDRQYFVIYGDSAHIYETYEIKNELIASYQQFIFGLDERLCSEAMKHFVKPIDHAIYQNHTIILTVGDGQGICLEGELKTNYCAQDTEEIETHFFFFELFTNR